MASSTAATLFCLQSQHCTQTILEAKKRLNKTWEQIAQAVGLSPVFVTSCCLGENSLHEPEAEKLVKFLEITDPVTKQTLMSCDLKAQTPSQALLQDPCLYRLHEANLVYGLAIKELIQEKFGDGIMSAIDFEVYVDKEENPKGDRVKITMSGKYLPYRKW